MRFISGKSFSQKFLPKFSGSPAHAVKSQLSAYVAHGGPLLAFAPRLGYPKRELKSLLQASRVKQLSSRRAAIALLVPVLVWLAAVLAQTGTAEGQTVTGPAGTLVVALTGAPPAPNLPFTPGFTSLSFNVLAVKLNPSTDPNIFQNQADADWTTIPVAPGVGLNNVGTVDVFTQLATLFNLNTFGPNPGAAGTGPSELQVDLNQIQTVPILFNAALVPASTYHAIELVLDGSNAGTAVPTCLENPSSLLEGCIASQISMVNPSQFLTLSSTTGFSVPLNGLATMVISISPVTAPSTFPGRPGFSGGFYQFSPSIQLAPLPPPPAPPSVATFLGLVTGAAFGASQVAAELASTGQVVETTTTGGGQYQLPLPASINGTLYDLVASGPGFAYAFAHNVLVQRSQVKAVQLDAAPAGQIALTGKVTDGCSGMPLQGATLQIVAPAVGSGADCTQVPTPSACVVLASANTDDTGTYPMPGSNFVVPSFNHVPNGSYTMVVSDAGYDTVASKMSVSGGAVCSAGSGGLCNFALGRSTIEGLVTISPPVPSPRALNVLVTAEDHGTHRIENVALTSVPVGSNAAPFTMFVPEASSVSSLDLYATVSDYFNGLPEKSSGHTIAILSGLATASRCGTAASHPILSMQCAGHGSFMGSSATFDDGTSIVLSKGGVQLMSTRVGPRGGTAPGQFSICAPADTTPYELQRFEANPPEAQPSPAAAPTSETMTQPLQIPQPCNSICGSSSGPCLVCTNSNVVVP
jgi:hypothetical protein